MLIATRYVLGVFHLRVIHIVIQGSDHARAGQLLVKGEGTPEGPLRVVQ